MNVLLTTSAAPIMSPFSTDEKRPPLGLGSLIAVLGEVGHAWLVQSSSVRQTVGHGTSS